MSEFHFLRPAWLLMLLPVFLLAWQYWRWQSSSRDWSGIIDARLLPHLLVGQSGKKKRWPGLLALPLALLSIIALAGPVWQRLPQPVFKQQSALVVLLDLSQSMNAQDIKPSRIARARLKLIDLLKQRKEGQTALVAYAATAYTVTPLTDDVDTIESLVSSLSPEIMPAQGSRPDRAIQRALELFRNAGLPNGDILLMTDSLSATDQARIDALDLDGFRLSVISVGTAEGGPIPLPEGGFVKDQSGSIVVAKTDPQWMQKIAAEHGGIYSALTVDDRDIERLQQKMASTPWKREQKKLEFTSDRWQEQGPWLLLLVTPLVALAFRRGILMSVMLVFLLLPVSRPADALQLDQWRDWFRNDAQKAQQLLQQGKAGEAAEKFQRPDWKGAALYKSGDYPQAAEQLEQSPSLEAQYNRANALAKMGQLEQALKAYDQVLQKNPQHEDAAYNRKLVEEALKKQQQQQNQDQQNQDQKNQDQKNQDQQSQDQQSQDQQSQDQQSQDQQSQDQQNQDQQSRNRQQQDDKAIDEQARKDQQQEEQKKEQQQKKQDKARQEQQKQDQQQNEPEQKQDDAQSLPKPTEQDLKQQLDEQAEAQWLRRIPDDPGGLLRNKFRYQYRRQQPSTQETQQW